MSILDIDENIRNDDYTLFDGIFRYDTFGNTLNNIYNIYKDGCNQGMNHTYYAAIYSDLKGISIHGPRETLNIGYIFPVNHPYFACFKTPHRYITNKELNNCTYPRIILIFEISEDLYNKLLEHDIAT